MISHSESDDSLLEGAAPCEERKQRDELFDLSQSDPYSTSMLFEVISWYGPSIEAFTSNVTLLKAQWISTNLERTLRGSGSSRLSSWIPLGGLRLGFYMLGYLVVCGSETIRAQKWDKFANSQDFESREGIFTFRLFALILSFPSTIHISSTE